MSLESPPRLKLDSELGPILRGADDAAISADRVAANGAAIKATIAGGLALASPLFKIGVLAVLLIGGVVVQRQLAKHEPPTSSAPATRDPAAVRAEPAAAVVPPAPVVEPAAVVPPTPVVEPAAAIVPPAPVVEPAAAIAPSAPVVEPAAAVVPRAPVVKPVVPPVPVVEPAVAVVPRAPVVEPAAAVVPRAPASVARPSPPSVPAVAASEPRVSTTQRMPPGQSGEPAASPPPKATTEASPIVQTPPPVAVPTVEPLPPSDLPDQIKLYEAARSAKSRKQFAVGLEKLDELLRRFPGSPLRADVELTRAELLMLSDRLGDAATALEALAVDPSHLGRRGELLRTLGDVRRKQKDCPRALDAYARARAAGLSAQETTRVDRGIERCAPAP